MLRVLEKNWHVYKVFQFIDTRNQVLWSHVMDWHVERLNFSIVSDSKFR